MEAKPKFWEWKILTIQSDEDIAEQHPKAILCQKCIGISTMALSNATALSWIDSETPVAYANPPHFHPIDARTGLE
jgi:hypothetical protein